jgi:hypothetical protein
MFDFDVKGTAEDKDELADSMNNLNVEASSSGQVGPTFKRKPVIIIVVGMAGNPARFFRTSVIICYFILKIPAACSFFNSSANGSIFIKWA